MCRRFSHVPKLHRFPGYLSSCLQAHSPVNVTRQYRMLMKVQCTACFGTACFGIACLDPGFPCAHLFAKVSTLATLMATFWMSCMHRTRLNMRQCRGQAVIRTAWWVFSFCWSTSNARHVEIGQELRRAPPRYFLCCV